MQQNELKPKEGILRKLDEDLFGTVPKRQKGIKSKEKGDKAELKIAKHLTAWTGHEFNRTPGSGGLGWKVNGKVVGDVICSELDWVWDFVNEVKSYRTLSIKNGSLTKTSKIFGWWRQVVYDCERVGGKLPLLFCRENDMPKQEFILFVQPGMAKVLESFGLSHICSGVSIEGYTIYGFLLSTVLSKVPFEQFLLNTKILLAEIFG